jgi:predicted amidohydrolase YtcJ
MMDGVLLFRGRVWGHPASDAVLLRDSRIAGIGRRDDFAAAGARDVDVAGGWILPGFIDGHTHLIETGLVECGWAVDLTGCRREDALDRMVRAASGRRSGEWLLASGWDESRWRPARRLERRELDRAVPDVPVIAVRVDGHLAILNALALGLARMAVAAKPELFDVALGEAREAAVDDVRRLAHPGVATIDDALRAAARSCHRLGITTAHVMSGLDDPQMFLAAAESLRLRLVVHPPVERLEQLTKDGICSGQGDEWARWGGVKLFADGSIGARNAAVSTPYASGGRGRLNHRLEWLVRRLAAADRLGWQTLTHAIGDRGIRQVLQAHRRASSDRGLRHRVEHFEFPTREHIAETRDLGLYVCAQPNFIGNWSGSGGLYASALGEERDAGCNPLRDVLDAGICLGFGSDGMPLSPLYGISSAVHAPHAGQRVTLEEAVRGYTSGSAELSRGVPSMGRLTVGAPGDIVVIDGALDGAGAGERRVAQTWVAGERVYERTEDR